VYNVLSNAFKYTPVGGEISVKMSLHDRDGISYMRLSVSDSGKGIAEEDLPHIFKRFYISRNADQSQSHGIGLALTSDLLQLHKGSIEVKSHLDEGSVFTIEIPVSANAYTPEEMSDDESGHNELGLIQDLSDQLTQEEIAIEESESGMTIEKDFSILIAEDNKELNKLIADSFSDRYHVLTAEDGVKALELIQSNEIDLVISDVMMPGMDGLTLCKLVKNDVATSHIHMLMLTAKNTTEDRIDCYNAGADAYIAKPFELKVLRARVKNLISKRVQKAETFKSNQEINISSMEYCSIDELFLKQAVKIVEEKISDDTFDFDQFAMDMATSKSTLHRKLKSLTGLSPGEFIRNVRLKHAVQMLNNNVGNISEIAFAVGFNDPKYFSRCFKIEFGMTPKEFQEAHRVK
jgi:DNA-binding response OmpR family regulator